MFEWVPGVCIIVLIIVMSFIGFMSLFESKLLASVHLSVGSSILGLFGLLQPIADGVKCVAKLLVFIVKLQIISIFISLSLMFNVFGIVMLMMSNDLFSMSCVVFVVWSFVVLLWCLMYLLFFSAMVGFLSSNFYTLLSSICLILFSTGFEMVWTLWMLSICMFHHLFGAFVILSVSIDSVMVSFSLVLFSIFILILFSEISSGFFDYLECESELVLGLITELSFILFIFFTLVEYLNMFIWIIITSVLIFIFNLNLSVLAMLILVLLSSGCMISLSMVMSVNYLWMLGFCWTLVIYFIIILSLIF